MPYHFKSPEKARCVQKSVPKSQDWHYFEAEGLVGCQESVHRRPTRCHAGPGFYGPGRSQCRGALCGLVAFRPALGRHARTQVLVAQGSLGRQSVSGSLPEAPSATACRSHSWPGSRRVRCAWAAQILQCRRFKGRCRAACSDVGSGQHADKAAPRTGGRQILAASDCRRLARRRHRAQLRRHARLAAARISDRDARVEMSSGSIINSITVPCWRSNAARSSPSN